MPALNIRDVEQNQIDEYRRAAMRSGQTLHDWALAILDHAAGSKVAVEVSRDEKEKLRRKQNKEDRHAELKADAQAAVEAEGVPAKFIERINTPSSDHHANCPCMRCEIRRAEERLKR